MIHLNAIKIKTLKMNTLYSQNIFSKIVTTYKKTSDLIGLTEFLCTLIYKLFFEPRAQNFKEGKLPLAK